MYIKLNVVARPPNIYTPSPSQTTRYHSNWRKRFRGDLISPATIKLT